LSGARKLAAILAADVVGYSRLMGEDEAGTAKAVRERREAATPIARAFGGRLVKTAGDGALLEVSLAGRRGRMRDLGAEDDGGAQRAFA
jgi:class 3 adenylate cyclase